MGSGLEYGTAYYTVFVFESSGSAKYAVVQVPLRFRFDREVLVFSQAAPLPDVGGGGGGKENNRASGRAGERASGDCAPSYHALVPSLTHTHTYTQGETHRNTYAHTCTHRGTGAHTNTHTLS